MLKSSVKMSRS